MTAANARVCMVSLRGTNKHVAWCTNYEFEDVVCSIDAVELFNLVPGRAYDARQWIVRRLPWRPGVRLLTPHMNPGLQPIVLQKDYDLFAFFCMNPADLIHLAAIKGWKDRCRKRICYVAEFYVGWEEEFAFHLSLLKDFDVVALCYGDSVRAVQSTISTSCHHVPLGVDILRFSPYPNTVERCIDVYSMGRRVERVHDAFLAMAAREKLFYVYDTVPSMLLRPENHRQHRDLVASCAKRSRLFVAYPAKIDTPGDSRGQSEGGARFFEGAAAGAVLIGQTPSSVEFAENFDWPDAVVDIGATEESVQAALGSLLRQPERMHALSRKNAVHAIRHFDWCYRWKEMLRILGMDPLPGLKARQELLAELAEAADASHAP